jgi:hypothetical protein
VEFGRELSAEKDLDKMLGSVVDRLSHTLLVDRMGVFLASNEIPVQFQLAKSFGIAPAGAMDLSFLGCARPPPNLVCCREIRPRKRLAIEFPVGGQGQSC